ncbi:hypothetical protein ASAP_2320 [Asaia bogorensis]|uniref:Uncharacterized protein n=1 Tax=Asaia bogorensis TaxID=91915 RepID=A0A060QHD9_9PROT|nr:hypothetical protein ASAP_2320 [Asaia bogorensis]
MAPFSHGWGHWRLKSTRADPMDTEPDNGRSAHSPLPNKGMALIPLWTL